MDFSLAKFMKKVLMALLFLLLASGVYAQVQCVDTDGGGKDGNDDALKNKGEAKVGITPKVDVCLTSEEGVSINESKYLKEYYCTSDNQVSSEVYDCTREGYEGCRNGACYGSGSSSSQNASSSSSKQVVYCGNKILEKDKGEQCDPPDSICFGKTKAQYGICSKTCQCQISGAAEPVKAVCGDGTLDSPDEDCEKDDDCGAGFVCSSCKCVKQLTQEEIEAMKKGETPVPQDKGGSEEEPEKEVETSGKGVIDTTPKNFSDSGALKATSSVASFFKSIFSWFGSLFS